MNKKELDSVIKQLPSLAMPELNRLIEEAQKAQAEVKARASETMRSKIDALLREGGFETISQVYGKKKGAGVRAAAKYRHPDGTEWTGQGRPPNVFKALKEQGVDLEQYRIKDGGAAAA